MLEINEEVLNLTEKYPELMKYVKSQEGVLTLDVESAEVQNVLRQKQGAALAAQNNALVMKQRRSEA
jgi:hypothetical protein